MLGTIEALGVFLLAIVPGFLALRVYGLGQPPLRVRGALSELGAAVLTSAVGWTFLYLWRGRDLLPIVLGEEGKTTAERLDAFAELAALSVAIGLGLGAAARIGASVLRATGVSVLATLDKRAGSQAVAGRSSWRQRVERWLAREIRARSRPGYAWDRLLSRLASRGDRVVCQVRRKSGHEVVGVLARGGWLDWEADVAACCSTRSSYGTPTARSKQ